MISGHNLKHMSTIIFCFRLLNSEIGNDPVSRVDKYGRLESFRLLNSEIGNDPSNIKMASEWGLRP